MSIASRRLLRGVVHTTSGGGGLPAGVTLRPIDGGPNYYQDNGFTNAANSAFNGMSWDDPRFFPIGQDYSFYDQNSTTTYKDMGLNYVHRVTAPTDMSLLRNAGIWALLTPGEGVNPGAETVGWHVEEPQSWADITNQVQNIGSALTGRFLQISCTWSQLFYGEYGDAPGDHSMQNVMSSPISTSVGDVHLNIPGDDEYWFAARDTGFGKYVTGEMYNNGVTATADQVARGDHYGDMVDTMRSWMTTYPAPVGAPYIETDDGLLGEADRRRITPPELNWAVWSTLVHGARWVMYFSATTNYSDQNTFGFDQAVLPGQTVSMYNQAKSTHTLIKNLAPILNAPFALNYATVTPAGYVFPTRNLTLTNGIDIMTKYYTGGSYSNSTGSFSDGLYIFSTVRGSEAQTNINATFTIKNTGATTVTVLNENASGVPTPGQTRTIPVTNSGTTFTDTFAKASTIHIYKVN